MNKLSDFKKMHQQKELLFLPNAWDVLSALILQQVGFKAIGTTSWGIANSMGYKDGERIEFDALVALIDKMVLAVEIPITVDIESGYADNATAVAENVLKIADLGVSGINIEDSLKRESALRDKNTQCELIMQIKNKLDENGYREFFINARTDTYLQNKNPLSETIERSIDYVGSGADGIFVPGVCDSDEIKQLVDAIDAPLNVMSLPNLTDISASRLNELGVKRFSLGNAFSDATVSFIEQSARMLFTKQNTDALYAGDKIRTAFK